LAKLYSNINFTCMCQQYALVSNGEAIKKAFDAVNESILWKPTYNIIAGSPGLIITQDNSRILQWAEFGYNPPEFEERKLIINIRSEGDKNKDNRPDFRGGMGVISKRLFVDAIRKRRCIVIADCFYAGVESSKPYLIYLVQRHPFAMAGIYSDWRDPLTGKIKTTFGILTTFPNHLMLDIGCHRCPVILRKGAEKSYLKETASLAVITKKLIPYQSSYMNGYPITTEIKDQKKNNKNLVQPIGPKVQDESAIIIELNRENTRTKFPEMNPMSKKYRRDNKPKSDPWW
jgi:putative SOS response-associated peptidase YedK